MNTKWTPKQKRQYIEMCLRQLNELTAKQTDIIQDPSSDIIPFMKLRLTEITDSIRDINEKIRNRMEGSNWSKYN
mgnify:CR=1 FL=1